MPRAAGGKTKRFRRYGGNADVIRQELAEEKAVHVSLRTVERTVAPLRRELMTAARTTVRFETQLGDQLRIDFGARWVETGSALVKVFFFEAMLGYVRLVDPDMWLNRVLPFSHS